MHHLLIYWSFELFFLYLIQAEKWVINCEVYYWLTFRIKKSNYIYILLKGVFYQKFQTYEHICIDNNTTIDSQNEEFSTLIAIIYLDFAFIRVFSFMKWSEKSFFLKKSDKAVFVQKYQILFFEDKIYFIKFLTNKKMI